MVAALTSACDPGWPPQREEAVAHFAKHKSEIEMLEARILAADYWLVSSGAWRPGSDETPDYIHVTGDIESRWDRRRITGDDAIEWNEAFRAAGTYEVSQDERGTSFEIRVKYPQSVLGLAHYVRPAETEASPSECRKEFRDVRCGECGIALDDGWWLLYRWVPSVLDPDLYRAQVEGEISQEEWEERHDELLQACWMEGAEIIGIPGQSEDSDD